MKPIIGITPEPKPEPENARTRGRIYLNWNYADAVVQAGGVPVIIPPQADVREVAKFLHGWLIPGGYDIDPKQFGQAPHSANELQDPSRYELESRLFNALDPNVPVLGICYGCQVLNVLRGGDLVQHIPDELGHNGHDSGDFEPIEVEAGTKLAAITGTKTRGRSYHHQAVGQVGKGLKVSATSEDGIIEAIEATDRPWMVAVQWHPERSLEDAESRKLFQEFVEQARRFAAGMVAK
ncbi:MAG: gamma-glutamyl-gamma-aminobutyrate hydrolase family protein [Armatimonadetes bacterium]|nr:gamma-glutamyl-gamma-aminobutyrate hydrolase family protein [Armatimonadota bacterium]